MKPSAISCLLILRMAVMPLAGQGGGPVAGHKLNIVVTEGEGVIHNLRKPQACELALRVEDENKRPVMGATVALTLPAQGASGTFANHAVHVEVTTDKQGMAMVRHLRPNTIAGKVEIRILASYKGQTAHATMTQFNMLVQNAARKSSFGKIIAILAVAGAAAAGGAYAGLHKNGAAPSPTPAPPPPIGITPGTGIVGAPQ